ncbi:hypothetical protein Trydic_g20085 [Trypoxylus dichotomus]
MSLDKNRTQYSQSQKFWAEPDGLASQPPRVAVATVTTSNRYYVVVVGENRFKNRKRRGKANFKSAVLDPKRPRTFDRRKAHEMNEGPLRKGKR